MSNNDIPRLPRRNKGSDDPKMIGLWKIGRTIGSGAQGRVRIARHARTGQYAAIKIISKFPGPSQLEQAGFGPEGIQHSVEREIVIMKLIDHPNIMRLYDVWETSTDLYLILEYVEGGELFDYLCSKGRLPTSEALGYFQQLISAVHYCHRFNIAHRDLKPENLLLDLNKNIKVADFGLAAYGANDGLLNTFCGSPHYAAPEVISGQVYNGSCSDTWSCGIILHALLVGKLPFEADDCQVLKQQILRAEIHMPHDTDPLAKDLVSKMLEKDVTKRITISDILKHPFYISQKPKEFDRVVPSLDVIARPIGSLSFVDPDIFANLRTLWPNTPEERLIECLRNGEKNWQKGIYHLLEEYRSRHLENYDEEEEMLRKRAARRSKRVKRSKPLSHGMHKTTSRATDLEHSPSSLPPRAAPPTPRRASRGRGGSTSTLDIPLSLSPSPSHTEVLQISHDSRSVSHSTDPSPTSPLSPVWAALNLPPLDVPELQDEKIQQFFHQIVDHLNAMQQRTVILGGASPVPGASPNLLMTEEPMFGGHAGNTTSIGLELRNHGFLTSGASKGKGKNDTSMANKSNFLLPSKDTYGLKISNERNGTRPLVIRRSKRDAVEIPVSRAEKENEDDGYLIIDMVAKKSSLKNKERTALGNRRVQIVEPETERGKLRKKRSVVAPLGSPASVSVAGSSFVLPSPSSPKRTWFENVFRFKPAMYQLLSMHDVQTSRSECRRLLMGLGVHVMLTQAEGLGVLKCRLDEVNDPAGVMTTMKAVRFRVEMHSADPAEGYPVALYFVQEKGAGSSFRLVYERMRQDWELDGSGTPDHLDDPGLAPLRESFGE